MYYFLVYLLQPHIMLFLAACWQTFRLWRRRGDPTRRWWPLGVSLAGLAILSTPAVVHLAWLSLETYAAPLDNRPADAQAIVIFTAGSFPPEGRRTRAELNEYSLHRALQGAALYSPGTLVLVSGGKVHDETPGPSEAAVMGEFLTKLGVQSPDLVLEEESRTTYENALKSAEWLQARGIKRVVLVADAVAMARAAGCLRAQKIEVYPAPCHIRAACIRWSLYSFLPSVDTARDFEEVWHEWLGLAWYGLRGRI